jgi:hypothetical protein
MSVVITIFIMCISSLLIFISALAFAHGIAEIVKGDHEWSAFVTTGFFAILFILGTILLQSSTGDIGANSYNISEPIQKSRVVITDSNAVIIKANGTAITTDKYKYITILNSLDSVCLNTQVHSNMYGDVFKETVSISNCK